MPAKTKSKTTKADLSWLLKVPTSPKKDWSRYCSFQCTNAECDKYSKTYYSDICGSAILCKGCGKYVAITGKFGNPDRHEIKKWRGFNRLSHVRMLPNGKEIGVTSHGDIIDDNDFRKKLAQDPLGYRRAGLRDAFGNLTKKGKKLAHRKDWEDLG